MKVVTVTVTLQVTKVRLIRNNKTDLDSEDIIILPDIVYEVAIQPVTIQKKHIHVHNGGNGD